MKSEPLRLYLFCCLTSFEPDDFLRAFAKNGDELKIVPLPCSGKIDILYLTKAFETGADGVAVVTCKQGECRFLEGNLRARRRVEAVGELLSEIGLENGRTAVIQLDDSGINKVVQQLEGFRSKLRALPRLAAVAEPAANTAPAQRVTGQNYKKLN